MKKPMTFFVAFLMPFILLAQENEQMIKLKLSGFVRNEAMFNSRQNVMAREEGLFYLAPKPVVPDANGKDINAAPNFQMAGMNTRLKLAISGPELLGAKSSAVIEGDFFGISTANKFNFRMRHAFMKLAWDKSSLLVGQYWHPMFVTGCYPTTVSFGAGVPFNPFARVPQIRYTYNLGKKLSVFASVNTQGQYKSKGATSAHQNAAIPEINAQIQYLGEMLQMGAGASYQVLRPALLTTVVDTAGVSHAYVSDARVNSLSFLGYVKVTTKPVTLKAYGSYGQSNDNLVMMGGYAQNDNSGYTAEQLATGFVEYVPYDVLAAWIDVHSNGKKFQYGLFVGYAENMGAKEMITRNTFVGRWGDVSTMLRIAPRITYTVGNMKFGFEIEYSEANYAKGAINGTTLEELTGIDDNGKVTSSEKADNIKPILIFQYNF